MPQSAPFSFLEVLDEPSSTNQPRLVMAKSTGQSREAATDS
jgi:hypothetical protein